MSESWESKAEKAKRDEVESELAHAGVATVLDAVAVQQLLGLKCSRTVLRLIERGELLGKAVRKPFVGSLGCLGLSFVFVNIP